MLSVVVGSAAAISFSEMLSVLPPSLVAGEVWPQTVGSSRRDFLIRGSCLNEFLRGFLCTRGSAASLAPHMCHSGSELTWWNEDQNALLASAAGFLRFPIPAEPSLSFRVCRGRSCHWNPTCWRRAGRRAGALSGLWISQREVGESAL